MPYELRGNCVHKKGEMKPLKCYDNHKDALDYFRALQANADHKSFTVTKSANGRYRYNCRSSVNARDRDGEIVSKAALEADVQRTKMSGDDSEFWLYHVPYRLGGAPDWRGVINGCLVETGEFDDTPIAKAVAEFIYEHPEGIDGTGWGISIGFFGELNSKGIFTRVKIKERSVLPQSDASNPYTAFNSLEVRKMTLKRQQRQFLDTLSEMAGDDELRDAAQEILSAVGVGKSLDNKGLERKIKLGTKKKAAPATEAKKPVKPAVQEVEDEPDVEDEDEELEDDEENKSVLSDDDLAAIAKFVDEAVETRVKAAVDELTEGINEALGNLVEVTKDYQDRIDALEAGEEEARELYEQPRNSATYNRLKSYSASLSEETEVEAGDPLSQPNPQKATGAQNNRRPFGTKKIGEE